MSYKLGSLFDGSGGFPLAGSLCGIEPRWASEVEPYPIAVTRSRFPNMKHLGDISQIKGAEIEPVDIITFGSPCQDLSVAGKRAGLKHEVNGDEETTRSGLFMEAVRIIKEMRKATNGKYPRFALWENVPGAFSSNRGEDFRIVCEELIKVVEPSAVMPEVPEKGWAYADSYVGDGWSLAYRVFDAQYWGVPQRRRRILLVVDFRGECAREVLFEREGVRGYFTQSGKEGQRIAADIEGSAGADDKALRLMDAYQHHGWRENDVCGTLTAGQNDTVRGDSPLVCVPYTLKIRSGCEGGGKGALIQENKSATLATNNDQYLFQPIPIHDQATRYSGKRGEKSDGKGNGFGVGVPGDKMNTLTSGDRHAVAYSEPICVKSGGFCPEQSAKTRGIGFEIEKSPTLRAGVTPGVVTNYHIEPIGINGDKAGTIDASYYKGCGMRQGIEREVVVCTEPKAAMYWDGSQTCGTLTANNAGGNQRMPDKENFNCVVEQRADVYRQGGFADYVEGEVGTLKASGGDLGGGSENLIVQRPKYIVRRLTPTECARLQGFADRWGYIEPKESLTDEEYAFWTEVRMTHAIINGKEPKTYGRNQMLAWYNKLYTDSAEYKMWGNGIALPPALYCMQGMTEALINENPLTQEEINEALDKAFDIIGESDRVISDDPILESVETDLSEAPEEIKAEIIKNDELLKDREIETEKEEIEIMNPNDMPKVETANEGKVVKFDAVEQLRKLAAERKALSNLKPENERFTDDVRAIEYAVSVLEAVGL